MAAPKGVYKTKAEVREAFNAQQFEAKAKRGPISYRQEGKASPAPAHLNFPEGTVSRRVAVIGGNGKKLAICHQYLLPGGSIGASGLNDPKQVLVGDELWMVDPSDKSN